MRIKSCHFLLIYIVICIMGIISLIAKTNQECSDSLQNTINADTSYIKFDSTHSIDELDEIPKMLESTQPPYGIQRHISKDGTAVVKILIDENGKVIDSEIVKSFENTDEQILSVAKSMIFSPGKIKGKVVKVTMLIPFKFKMQH